MKIHPSAAEPFSDTGAPGGSSEFQQRVRSLRLPKDAAGGGKGGLIPWALCLIFAASTAVLAYRSFSSRTQEQPAAAKSAEVSAAAGKSPPAPAPQPGDVALEAKGYIIPAQRILVSPKVAGMLMKFKIIEGQRVAKDQVLGELEDTDYRADRDRAQAILEAADKRSLELHNGYRDEEKDQARAELAESQEQLVQLMADWERAKSLLRGKTISREQYDAAESKFLAMKRRIDRLTAAVKLMEKGYREERKAAAKAEVRQMQAELAKAEWRLENCLIRAPIAGTILKKNAEEGNIVNPIAFNGSFSICEMADLSDLEVELSIQERDIAKITAGQPCTIRAEAFPDRTYRGFVSRLMPIADRAKGAVPVRVKVHVPREEEGVYLKPEMGAVVTFFQPKGAPTSP